MPTQSDINLQEQRTIIEQLQIGLARLPAKIIQEFAGEQPDAITTDAVLSLPAHLRRELLRELDRMDALVARWGALERIEQTRRESETTTQTESHQS